MTNIGNRGDAGRQDDLHQRFRVGDRRLALALSCELEVVATCYHFWDFPIAGRVAGQTQRTRSQHWEGDLLGPSAHLPKRWTGPGSTSPAPTFPNVGPADPMHTFAAAQRTPSQLPDGKLGSPSAHLPSIGEGTSQGPTHTFPIAGREARKCTRDKTMVLSRIFRR